MIWLYAFDFLAIDKASLILGSIFLFFVCFFTIMAVSLTLLVWYGNRNRTPRKPNKSALDRAKIRKQSDHLKMTYEEVNTNENVQ